MSKGRRHYRPRFARTGVFPLISIPSRISHPTIASTTTHGRRHSVTAGCCHVPKRRQGDYLADFFQQIMPLCRGKLPKHKCTLREVLSEGFSRQVCEQVRRHKCYVYHKNRLAYK